MDAKTTATAPQQRSRALIVATAAVTLAIGTTLAALTGYLGPRGAPADPAPAQPVFVPVTNQPATPPAIAPAAEPQPEPVLAVYRGHDDDEDDDDGEHEHGDHDD